MQVAKLSNLWAIIFQVFLCSFCPCVHWCQISTWVDLQDLALSNQESLSSAVSSVSHSIAWLPLKAWVLAISQCKPLDIETLVLLWSCLLACIWPVSIRTICLSVELENELRISRRLGSWACKSNSARQLMSDSMVQEACLKFTARMLQRH